MGADPAMTDSPKLPFDPILEARRHWVDRGWSDAADGMAALTSVMRVQQIFLSRVEAVLRPLGLTFARFELLALLAFSRHGALPLGKLGVRLQVHPASVTNAVDRLEEQGLVRRVRHLDDGRITLATITADGRALMERAAVALNEAVFTDLGVDGPAARDLVAGLEVLRRDAGDF
jgi:DNA-binding MarR family transcriptional regulator